MSALTDEGAQQIDVVGFLKNAKITEKADVFKSKQISIEELLEFTPYDLESFAKDLALDALEKNRFIKAISKHKQNQKQKIPPIATASITSISTRKSHVIISAEEHNAITQLYERYNKSSTLSTSLQSAILLLNDSESDVIKQIENVFETLSTNLQNKREYLLKDITNMMQKKKQLLTQQLSIFNGYINSVQQGKLKYDEYITDSTLNIHKRKKMILKMVNDVMNRNNISIAMLTAPNLQFDITKNEKQLNQLCANAMKLNDCDQPRALTLSIRKTGFSTINVQFEFDSSDIISSKNILGISLEHAILPKSFVMESAENKNKKRSKKNKKYESKSDDDSDSDRSSESRNEAEFESNDTKLSNFDDINIDSVKWKINSEIKFSKKHRKRNKYKIEDLKSNRVYILRMRAKNDCGWSEYCNIVMAATKKGFMDSWNRGKKGPNISIQGNVMTATNNSWGTVYGKAVCKKGYKYHWRMKVTLSNASSYHMMIGIVDKTVDITTTHCQSPGCWIYNPYGSGSNVYIDGKGGKNYAISLKSGDIVEMCLDLKKNFSLSFRINDTDYGSAMENLPKDKKYHLAISTSNIGTNVKLLKPK